MYTTPKKFHINRKLFTSLIGVGVIAGTMLLSTATTPLQTSVAERTKVYNAFPPPPLPIGYTEQEPNNAIIPSTATNSDEIREIRRQGSKLANGPVLFNKRIVGRMGREDDDTDWFYFDTPNVIDPLQIGLYFDDSWGGRTRVQLQVFFQKTTTKDGCDSSVDPRFYQSDCVIYQIIGDGKNSTEIVIPNAPAGRYYVAIVSAVGDRNRNLDFPYDLVVLTDQSLASPIRRSGKQLLPMVLNNTEGDIVSTPAATTFSYTDDFSDPQSGWQVTDHSGAKYAYVAGKYEMTVKEADFIYWTNRSFPANPNAYTIEVEAERIAPNLAATGDCGMIFDRVITTESDGVYIFRIDPAYGGFTLGRLIRYPSTSTFKALIERKKSSAITTGKNNLAISRTGANIKVYINDTMVGEVNDSALSNSAIGLTAAADTVVPAICRFDNFKIYDGPKGSSSPVVTPTPTPPVSSEFNSLDDFSNSGSGWQVVDDEGVKKGYINGEYEILHKTNGRISWTSKNFGVNAKNYTLEMDMYRGSQNETAFGGCGFIYDLVITNDNGFGFYNFQVDPSDSSFTIRMLLKNAGSPNIEYKPLVAWQTSSAIRSGTNRLKLIRTGSQMLAYINGQEVATANHNGLSNNVMGMYAENFNVAPISCRFDNFRVSGTRALFAKEMILEPSALHGLLLSLKSDK